MTKWLSIKKSFLARWILSFIDVPRLFAILQWPRYISHYLNYRLHSGHETVRIRDSYPCLMDRTQYTPFDAHYFHQACWLARKLAEKRPAAHVDIGSHVMTIGILSAFIDTTFIDYRPLQVSIEGLECRQGDVLELALPSGSVTSLSCLHVIEHVGLGRYGDTLSPKGSVLAAKELSRVLKPEGKLFISVPIGRERVCFNAHRVFLPETVLAIFSELKLIEFSFVDDTGVYHANSRITSVGETEYGCGMFVFMKEKEKVVSNLNH